MTDKDLYAGTIAALVDDYGEVHLARILNVTVADLHRWREGKARPPCDVFFRIINLSATDDAKAPPRTSRA
jgi:hypothetical protein